jgi:hypothetical protein
VDLREIGKDGNLSELMQNRQEMLGFILLVLKVWVLTPKIYTVD